MEQPDVRDAPPLVVLGCAAGKRARGLQAAQARLGLPPARIVEWRDWLRQPAVLEPLLGRPCRFKIEPPGDDPQVHEQLMRLGGGRLGLPPRREPLQYGELAGGHAWFEGFTEVLGQLEAQLAGCGARAVNPPADILAMTDKPRCQRRLAAAGVPVPAFLGPVRGYGDLCELMRLHGVDRVFFKSSYGSSSAGVVAYRRNRRGQEQAVTSAHLVEGGAHGHARLFNVKRLRSYTRREEIGRVMDLIAADGAYAEAWLDKPRSGAGHYDLRVLALHGRAAHRVARVSRHPMTNLHLDSRRADPAALLTAQGLQAMEATVEQAARVFPASRLIGFDVVVRGGDARVLEANAFGDLLPGLLWQGQDSHAAVALEAFA